MALRVLIIDDEENIRQMIRLTLEAAGYEVAEATDGLEAFAILGSDSFWDVILLDQRLPVMEGTEVLRRLKVLAPSSPVVMMTAFASIELAVEAMRIGAANFLRKPVTPELLRNSVAAAVSQHREPAGAKVDRSTMTMNGFTVLHVADAKEISDSSVERPFVVRTPTGKDEEVVIEISAEAITESKRLTHGALITDEFWTQQAAAFLSDFIWNDGHVPSGGRLMLKGADRDALEKVERDANSNG